MVCQELLRRVERPMGRGRLVRVDTAMNHVGRSLFGARRGEIGQSQQVDFSAFPGLPD